MASRPGPVRSSSSQPASQGVALVSPAPPSRSCSHTPITDSDIDNTTTVTMVASPSSSVLSSSSSTLTPTSSTPSTSTITPATYAAATTAATVSTQPVSSHRPYPLSASAAHAGGRSTPSAAGPDAGAINPPNTSRIPVTPAVLRAIFASSRSPGEERSLSRIAFYRFSGFIISCLAISLMANQGRGIRTGAALLGVGV